MPVVSFCRAQAISVVCGRRVLEAEYTQLRAEYVLGGELRLGLMMWISIGDAFDGWRSGKALMPISGTS